MKTWTLSHSESPASGMDFNMQNQFRELIFWQVSIFQIFQLEFGADFLTFPLLVQEPRAGEGKRK